MNTASEVLLLTRSLLRDTDFTELRFSDRELLDSLERVQESFISEFRENLQHITHTFKKGRAQTFELKGKIAYIYRLLLNNTPLPYAQSSRALEQDIPMLCHLGDRTYLLANYVVQDDDKLEALVSLCAPAIYDESAPLALDSSYNKALSLAIVCEMLLREPSAHNIQVLSFYERELEKAKGQIRAFKNGAGSKRVFATRTHF